MILFPDLREVNSNFGPEGDAGDVGSIPGLGRSPGVGNGNPLQYSCLGNSMDSGTWWATVHGSQRVEHYLATEHTQIIVWSTLWFKSIWISDYFLMRET